MQEAHPDAKMTELSKFAGEMWRAMTAAQKKVYVDKAAALREAALEEFSQASPAGKAVKPTRKKARVPAPASSSEEDEEKDEDEAADSSSSEEAPHFSGKMAAMQRDLARRKAEQKKQQRAERAAAVAAKKKAEQARVLQESSSEEEPEGKPLTLALKLRLLVPQHGCCPFVLLTVLVFLVFLWSRISVRGVRR